MYEDNLPPSFEVLELHSLWVLDYYGGLQVDRQVGVGSEPSNVRSRVAFLIMTHGCNCKTGCGTKRCKCVKAEHPCGPGCMYQAQGVPKCADHM